MFKKWICLLLSLVLCCGTLPAALAEEIIVSEEVGTEVDLAPAELDIGESLLDLGEETLLNELTTDEQQATASAGVDEDSGDADAASTAAETPAEFVPGYRRVATDEAALYSDAVSVEPMAVLYRGGILYAAVTQEDRLGVAFNSEQGIVTGYVSTDALEVMTDDEVAAFQSEIAREETQTLYQDDINIPLATPECLFLELTVEQSAAEATAAQEDEGQVQEEPSAQQVVEETAETDMPEQTAAEEAPVEEGAVDEAAVQNAEPKLVISATKATIGIKQTYALSPSVVDGEGNPVSGIKFTYSTSNKKGVNVSKKGVAKGLKKGTYTVTVTASNGLKATCRIKVVKAPSKVTLSPKAPSIGIGQTMKLKVSFPSGSMGSCTFTSSKKKIVSVDKAGNITGLKEGTSVIKVKTHNGKTAKVTVTVTKGPNFISLNGEYTLEYDEATGEYRVVYTKTLDVGRTFQITYENEYKTYGSVSGYSSDNLNVATVTDQGVVTALEPGVANITVRSTSGAEAILRVTVPGTPSEKIAFTASVATVPVGRAVAAPGLRGTNISAAALAAAQYQSSDSRVFTVEWSDAENRWQLVGVTPGTAMLVATAGSAQAQVEVKVTEAGSVSQIHFLNSLVYMNPGNSFVPTVLDEYDSQVSATLSSSDQGVVSVGDGGALTAGYDGTATVTATYGSASASMTVVVQGTNVTLSLDTDSLTLGVGQRYALKAVVNGDGAGSLTYQSSDTSVATVSATGTVIARAAGSTMITVTEPRGAMASCTVTVCAAPTSLSVEPASISRRLNEGGVQLSWSFGASDEAGAVSFTTGDASIATVSDTGYVSFRSAGSTGITVVTNNGLSATVSVTVLPDKAVTDATNYRLFAMYSYFDELPFTKNNASTMASVFGKSKIGGQTYTTKVLGNPSKTQVLSGISSFFAAADDNDVSIVYLCSHGHNTTASYSGYRMSLPGYSKNTGNPNYYMTSTEIFNCVSRISGNVVLILDSCYSGTFLQDMGSKLSAEKGRIAVLTAASNTRATYYNTKKNSVDFFTFFLLQGLGYNERDGWWNANAKASKGSYPGYLAADKTGNNDGAVTLGEFYDFASKCIAANIPSYMKKSWYWGDKKQVQQPRFYAGNLENLVIYQPK